MGRITILMYHAIDTRVSPITVDPGTFRIQMESLATMQIPVISLHALVDGLHRQDLPERAVVITFDDGFVSVYTHAWPVLLEYGFPATVFLVPGYCGKSNDWPGQPRSIPRMRLLNWSQIREMALYNIDFGAHSLSHPYLDRLPPDTACREVLDSKRRIEDRLGRPVHFFAYPYGRSSDAVEAVVRSAFRGACTTEVRYSTVTDDPWRLPRIETHYLRSPAIFRAVVRGRDHGYLMARRWIRAMGHRVLHRPWR